MQGRLQIETPEHAAAVRAQLEDLERSFRAGPDLGTGRDLAREIIRLRMSLTSYALRHQVREAHDRAEHEHASRLGAF